MSGGGGVRKKQAGWRHRDQEARRRRRNTDGRFQPASDVQGSVFFFQAEDGIRGGRVTGVQTCALPIFGIGLREPVQRLPPVVRAEVGTAPAVGRLVNDHLVRSEERRVGKESRCRGAAEFVKNKQVGVIAIKKPGAGDATLTGAFNQLQTYKAQFFFFKQKTAYEVDG